MPILMILLLLAAGAIWYYTSTKRLLDVIFVLGMIIVPTVIFWNASPRDQAVIGGIILVVLLLLRGYRKLRGGKSAKVDMKRPDIMTFYPAAKQKIAAQREADSTVVDGWMVQALNSNSDLDQTDKETILTVWVATKLYEAAKKKK